MRLLGDLLAGSDSRSRHLPRVPGGRDGLSIDSRVGVSASYPTYRTRRARVFRRGRDISGATSCAGTLSLVVVLFRSTRIRGADRMGLRISRSPAKPSESTQQTP